MTRRSLETFIQLLEDNNELIRIKSFVDPYLEISEITDRISKSKDNNKALLFENTGTDFPLLINSMGSEKRMCLALGVPDLDSCANEIFQIFNKITQPKNSLVDKLKMLPLLGDISKWMPSIKNSKGICQEIVHMNPDITKLPVLTCWPYDGGPFLTLPIVHTQDLDTQQRNVGLYRVQVFDKDLVALHWHKHKVSAGHWNQYKEANKKMPVAIAIGGDPIYSYCATAPLPPNVDEYLLAGFLRKQSVQMVKCLTQDIMVPDDADIIIEGFVDPHDELIWEGPFGDHTGYYSLPDFYPRMHITCITHKKKATYTATIVGIPPQEDAWIGKATERIFIAPIKMTLLPELKDMLMPIEGVFHNLTLLSIDKKFEGHAQKVSHTMWGAGQMMFNKILVICDQDIDLNQYLQVARAISNNCDPIQDFAIGQGPMDVLDHACSKFAFGGKLAIDATTKLPSEKNEDDFYNPTEMQNAWNNKTVDFLLNKYLDVKAINHSLVSMQISCVVVLVEKTKERHIEILHTALCNEPCFNHVKVILYAEPSIDVNQLQDIAWRVSNNYDPKRDTYFIKSNGNGTSHIGIDGTRKTLALDNFKRDWPNIITADDETIKKVDEKWENLGIGNFIPSPSLQYKNQVYGKGAVAES